VQRRRYNVVRETLGDDFEEALSRENDDGEVGYQTGNLNLHIKQELRYGRVYIKRRPVQKRRYNVVRETLGDDFEEALSREDDDEDVCRGVEDHPPHPVGVRPKGLVDSHEDEIAEDRDHYQPDFGLGFRVEGVGGGDRIRPGYARKSG